MPNLTTTIQQTKKIGSIIAAFLIVAVLVGGIYWRFFTQKEHPVNLSPPTILQDQQIKQPSDYDFSKVKSPQFPKKLPVFAAQKYAIDDPSAQSVATALGVGSSPKSIRENTLDGKLYTWQEGEVGLSLSQTTLIFEQIKTSPEGLPKSEEELADLAFSYLRNAPLIDKNLVQNPAGTKYIRILHAEGNPIVQDFATAQAVEFTYSKKLDSLPLLSNSPETPYAAVRIKKDGQVIYLGARYFENFNQRESYKLKSASDAIKEIKGGLGKIVLSGLLQSEDIPFGNLVTNTGPVTINSLDIAYFLPQDTNEPIQPIFIAEGSFQKGQEQGRIIIYLPAIKNLTNPKP